MFPEKHLAERLAALYFNHAYPQLPVLHRGHFLSMLHKAYTASGLKRSPQEHFVLNIVFAIGSGIIVGDKSRAGKTHQGGQIKIEGVATSPTTGSSSTRRRRLSTHQYEPEEYYAAAIEHLEAFLGLCSSKDQGLHGGLEELQAVLLLASFALLRPVSPGLWYIVGDAVRIALDLKLHLEDASTLIEESPNLGKLQAGARPDSEAASVSWTLDMRRRLFWCTYSFDRLVCVLRTAVAPKLTLLT